MRTAVMPHARPSLAFAIALPRKATSSTAVFASKTPAHSSAEYSPSERPAAKAGATPASRNIAVTPAAKATMQGWVYWVWLMTPSASVKQTSLRSKSTAAAASSKTARNAGLCSYKSAPMPACWLPWPAKTNATFMVFSFSALQLPCQPFHLAEAGFAAVHQAGEDLGHRADVV